MARISLPAFSVPVFPLRRTIVTLGLAVVLVAAVAGFSWYRAAAAGGRDDAGHGAQIAATAAAQAIFSYDYRTFDASVAKARTFVTGAFAKEYAQTTASLKATATSEQAVVQAQVSTTGVIDASAGKVDLLVYLNQYRRNTNVSGEKVDQNRVVLTMVRVGHAWKVSAASAI
jgi:Mce-associated membrane protein